MLRFLFLFVIASSIIVGCRKDKHQSEEENPTFPNPSLTIESRFEGIILDEDGEPIQDAIISIGDNIEKTDEDGFFRFSKQPLKAAGSLLKVTKTGYIPGYKTMYPHTKASSYLELILVKDDFSDNFTASQGGEINTEGGGKITFDPNSIVDLDGVPYNGQVKVMSHWYNPKEALTANTMPGNLQGKNADDEAVQLQSFGMMHVELIGDNGQELQLSEDSKAHISFPSLNESGLVGNMPLWHFDEDTGIWIEEGTATLVDDHYEGSVSHFSFWNCDIGLPTIFMEGRIVDPQGTPIANQPIYMYYNNWICAFGYTNAQGEFKGLIPQNVELTMKVIDCNIELINTTIGPYSNDVNLGDYQIQLTDFAFNIQGRLVDCAGQPNDLAYGFVNRNFISTNADGTFSKLLTGCGKSTLEALFIDPVNILSHQETIPTDQGDIDFGDIKICDLVGAYIKYTINGEQPRLATNPEAVFIGNNIYIENLGLSQDGIHFISELEGQGVGDRDVLRLNMTTNLQMAYSAGCGEYDNPDCSIVNWNITQSGGLNDTITGSFDGEVYLLRDTILQNPDEFPKEAISGIFNIPITKQFQPGKISGKVWLDEDGDGIRSTSENKTLFQYIYIKRTDGQKIPYTPNSIRPNDQGDYEITNLEPGDYELYTYTNYDITLYQQGGDPTVDNDFIVNSGSSNISTSVITVNNGGHVQNIDLGFNVPALVAQNPYFYGCIPNLKLSFPMKSGVPPYTFELSDGQTNDTGHFDISSPGNYSVTITDDLNRQTTADVDAKGYNNWVYGRVWQEDPNGTPNIRDNFEKGIPNIKVRLYTENDVLVETQKTNNYNYRFSNIDPGKYYLEIVPLTNQELVDKDAGMDDGVDSDFDPTTYRTEVFEFFDCDEFFYYDAGIK